MTRSLATVAVLLAVAGCGGGAAAATPAAAVPGAATDVRALAAQMEATHPDLYATVPRGRFQAVVEDVASRADRLEANELLVELMRIAALPGVGNGHGGIFPGDPAHTRQLHLYPLRLYTFPEGTYVVDERAQGDLTGAQLLAVEGTSWNEIARRVEPLVPRDNDLSLRGLLPHYALTAEVLDGLGLVNGVAQAQFTFRMPDGRETTVPLMPLSARRYTTEFADPHHGHYPASLPWRSKPMYQATSRRQIWLARFGNGRVVYVGYNTIFAPPFDVAGIADRVVALARQPKTERVIVDLRLNGGGDNTKYGTLLQALQHPRVNRRGRLYVLIGRATFSAAANLAADIDRFTRARFVGEPTGGGVKIYGETLPFLLPVTGLNARISYRYWDFGKGPNDRRLAIAPDVAVSLTARDYFAMRDPVLAAALAAP